MPSFSIQTLGCKVNQYDGAALAAALSELGLTPPAEGRAEAETCDGSGARIRAAGLVVINTCCVTAVAMAKARQAVRRALRGSPSSAVVVTGCYAQYDPARLAELLAECGVSGRSAVLARADGWPARLAELLRQWGLAGPPADRDGPARGRERRLGQRNAGSGCEEGLVTVSRPPRGNEGWMKAGASRSRSADGLGSDIRTRRLVAVKGRRAQTGRHGCAVQQPCGERPGAMPLPVFGEGHIPGPGHALPQTARKGMAPQTGVSPSDLPLLSRFPGHQRAFVKVQDGCDAFCAYCVVPYTRPIVEWRPPNVVEEECRRLLAAGHKELVLCGVFLGAYGHSTARRRRWGGELSLLPQLVRRIGVLPGLWRLRLSSLEPGDLTDELLTAVRDTPAAAWHFHLPLQSGSDRILKRMNRQYKVCDFRLAADRIRAACPDAAITTDILVGFPGESDEDFAATLAAARHAGFSKIHAFPFSAISGTAAWTYRKESPSPQTVRRRMAELASLEKDMVGAYRAQFVGRTMEALVEKLPGRGALGEAMTDRYLTVFFAASLATVGEVANFHITGMCGEGLEGRLEVRTGEATG